ncbi:MAG: N-acetyltransferase [Victivallales bacterium]|nr:N-acetyltransferase [Victivallales bacterium]
MAEPPSIIIRDAVLADAEAMLSIYAPYIEKTAITFEVEVPSIEAFGQRIRHVQEKYPWLVAVCNDELLGYAYLGEFKNRAAYAHSAETSIYVRMDAHGRGIGRTLYNSLEEKAHAMGLLNLNACIAYTETADDYLTDASVRFHERMGYVQCAHFHQCARKFGHWYDMIWMEKLFERR